MNYLFVIIIYLLLFISSYRASNAAWGRALGMVDELEVGLEQFLAVYARLPAEERAARIRRFMRRTSAQDAERVGEFFTSTISALNPLKQIKKEPADNNPVNLAPGNCSPQIPLMAVL
jgi:hypothetical protein